MMSQITLKEKSILRELAEQYMEICHQDSQDERRELWQNHNSLIKTRPPVLCDWHDLSNLWLYMLEPECVCEDPFLRMHELWLRNKVFHGSVNDDFVFEPWITVRAILEKPPGCTKDPKTGHETVWGIKQEIIKDKDPSGLGWRTIPVLKSREDLKKLKVTHHKVNEKETSLRVEKMQDIIGDIIEINVNQSSAYERYSGHDLSSALGYLWGIQEFMIDIYEQPDALHDFLAFMRDAVLENFEECEASGDWKLSNHLTTGQPYCHELPPPEANGPGVKMKDLWFFLHSQEFTLISPEHTWEFMLQYQLPILEKFGLTCYGCCEDLTNKIEYLKRIPNLRQIGITQWADLNKSAEQIGRDYVISWRPPPEMVCRGFESDRIRDEIRKGLEALEGCIVEIYLKDVSTVQGDPGRLTKWTRIAKEVAEEMSK